MTRAINVTRPFLPEFHEYCNEIEDLWDSRWLTNNGPKHLLLENHLRDYLDVPNLTLYTNGHLALENAIQSLSLNGEIITTPFTFISTTHAIVRSGCTPIFCDIDPENFTIDSSKIERMISDKTCAILPVHVYGNICDIDAIQQIADRYDLKVIYDAAHAFGVRRHGASIANAGDFSMFSFHATKVFHTIEGGCLTYQDKSLSKMLDAQKNFGIVSPDEVDYIGGNAKMSEFQAAMGLCNLRRIDDQIARRKLVFEHYVSLLSDIDGISLCIPSEEIVSNYAYFPVIFDNFKYNRDSVFEKLREHGVYARKYFYPLTNAMGSYKGRPGYDPLQTPVALRIANSVLTLPMYADLAEKDIENICAIILK